MSRSKPYIFMQADGRNITIRQAELDDIFDLRWTILRANLPRETAEFNGDQEPTTHHFGAFCDGVNVGCVSFMLTQLEDQPAWQLRGMATAPTYTNQGVGKILFQFAVDQLRQTRLTHHFWCNARIGAVGFYQKMGWLKASEQFEVPTAGPHYRMIYPAH